MKKLRVKRWVKSTLAILVIVFLVLTSIMYSFGAQMFTDVTDKHWAKKYVEDMASKKIITGYGDATFKPDRSVSRIEAIVMITRLFDSKDVNSAYEKNKSKYEKALKNYGILTHANWAKEEIVFALEKGILNNERLLSAFLKNGKSQNALRWEIAVYLARGLGFEDELSKVVVLGFKDSNKIPASARPYIDVLIKKGIINGKGDYRGNFNPNNPVTRAELAKMLSIGYKLIHKDGDTDLTDNDNKNNEDKKEEVLTSLEGKIYDVTTYGDKLSITIKDSRDKKLVFTNNKNDIAIKWGSKSASISDLKEGIEVSLTVSGSKVYSVKIKDIEVEKEGYFISASFDANGNHSVTFKIDDKYEEYKTDRLTKVELDGEKSSIYKLEKKDKVKIKLVNGIVREIEAISKDFKIRGKIKKVSKSEITIVDDDKTYKFDIDKDVDIERNDKKAEISDLRVGDKVRLEGEYNVVKDIEADSVRETVKGVLKEIKMSSTPEITILDEDDKLKTYKLLPGFEVEIDDEVAGLYDLRVNYKIKLTLESGEVTKIEGDQKVNLSTFVGEIIDISEKNDTIELKNSADGKTLYIKYDDDVTPILDTDGDKRRESNLDEGDIISVVGEDKLGTIEAKTIMLIENH
ncbi:S-layer homology domain-containing protein [Tepidibacter thalassicus]|uniref:S-layer homology domain-containing protein n=1 Tax=Tepidibacter thalassicus DSM 15285 TaxID=1123350 RepID=A0A1M5RA69_9FIRM|nr:S-layer homology domain-containing protein [Tepidibacter thalassicus]SHH22713.1 S-layer homology domain-containing protein [Tepidibacter thalassicus DSM 15285]